MRKIRHQYIKRETGEVCTEALFGDKSVRALYSTVRENAPAVFEALTSPLTSSLLGFVNFDLTLRVSSRSFCRRNGIDLSEAVDPPAELNTIRKVFERKICYWEHRPMPADPHAVVAPADAKVLVGSLAQSSPLFIKEKFFRFEELLGLDKQHWGNRFAGGDFAVFRLTPDKYHYNHAPVTGRVIDYYEIDGGYHSCNPSAIVTEVTPYSTNRRAITVIDTDVAGGTGAGLVAMIEVAALMIGQIIQCFSVNRYNDPRPMEVGMLLIRGQPKSLYRPGSSTDVLLFEKGRIEFAHDLITNQARVDVESRFSRGFGTPLVETEVAVRSLIAAAVGQRAEVIDSIRFDETMHSTLRRQAE